MVIYLCVGSTAGMDTLHIQSAYERCVFITAKFTKLCHYRNVTSGIAMLL